HRPAAQSAPGAHAIPQPPQCAGSARTSTQTLPHAVADSSAHDNTGSGRGAGSASSGGSVPGSTGGRGAGLTGSDGRGDSPPSLDTAAFPASAMGVLSGLSAQAPGHVSTELRPQPQATTTHSSGSESSTRFGVREVGEWRKRLASEWMKHLNHGRTTIDTFRVQPHPP